ncbi:MAG: LysR family transcriptional regulator [Deltaproteobacteria bacterium]|nr:LysR family transcriptional regulator [Deltaproteobacteria bacterium]
MNLELLKSFIAVVDTGGVTRAAVQLHMTQSTLSQQLSRLEDNLGKSLLRRTRQSVTLTEDGERFIGYARRILALDEEARDLLNGGKPFTLLRIGIPEDFSAIRLPEVLKGFASREKNVRLEVVSAMSSVLRERLNSGLLDIAVIRQEQADKSSLYSWKERLRWVVQAGTQIHRERPLPLVVFPQGCAYRKRAVALLDAAGIPWRITYESPNWSGIKAAVEGGFGLSLLDGAQRLNGTSNPGRAEGLPAPGVLFLSINATRVPLVDSAKILVDEILRLIRVEHGGSGHRSGVPRRACPSPPLAPQ